MQNKLLYMLKLPEAEQEKLSLNDNLRLIYVEDMLGKEGFFEKQNKMLNKIINTENYSKLTANNETASYLFSYLINPLLNSYDKETLKTAYNHMEERLFNAKKLVSEFKDEKTKKQVSSILERLDNHVFEIYTSLRDSELFDELIIRREELEKKYNNSKLSSLVSEEYKKRQEITKPLIESMNPETLDKKELKKNYKEIKKQVQNKNLRKHLDFAYSSLLNAESNNIDDLERIIDEERKYEIQQIIEHNFLKINNPEIPDINVNKKSNKKLKIISGITALMAFFSPVAKALSSSPALFDNINDSFNLPEEQVIKVNTADSGDNTYFYLKQADLDGDGRKESLKVFLYQGNLSELCNTSESSMDHIFTYKGVSTDNDPSDFEKYEVIGENRYIEEINDDLTVIYNIGGNGKIIQLHGANFSGHEITQLLHPKACFMEENWKIESPIGGFIGEQCEGYVCEKTTANLNCPTNTDNPDDSEGGSGGGGYLIIDGPSTTTLPVIDGYEPWLITAGLFSTSISILAFSKNKQSKK